MKMLESFGMTASAFENFQLALERVAELISERMLDKENKPMNPEEGEKENLFTISSLRILESK
jgi:hypothetical protein